MMSLLPSTWPVSFVIVGTDVLLGATLATLVLLVFFRARPWLKRRGLVLLVYPVLVAPLFVGIFVSKSVMDARIPHHPECWLSRAQQTLIAMPEYCFAERHYWDISLLSWCPLWGMAMILCIRQGLREQAAGKAQKRPRPGSNI